MSDTLTVVDSGIRTKPRLRLAELVAALSLGIDLGFGQPMEHVLRQCLIALRLADHLGLGDGHGRALYYAALLVDVGCHTDAHEQAKWFGDDIAAEGSEVRPRHAQRRGHAQRDAACSVPATSRCTE